MDPDDQLTLQTHHLTTTSTHTAIINVDMNMTPITRINSIGDDDQGVRVAGGGRSIEVAAVAAGARPMETGGLGDEAAGDGGEVTLDKLPVELLFHIMGFLDVNDLLSTSRTNHQLRSVSLTPLLHIHRIRRVRFILPPKLWSPLRPSLADLISRSIFLTQTTVVSKRLARSLVSIRLARRLAARPSPETLAERAVLPKECLPPSSTPRPTNRRGHPHADDFTDGKRRTNSNISNKKAIHVVQVSPALVQKRKAVERERIKDTLRRWVEGKWRREVDRKGEMVRMWEEQRGVGRVWRLRRFWERVGRGEEMLT